MKNSYGIPDLAIGDPEPMHPERHKKTGLVVPQGMQEVFTHCMDIASRKNADYGNSWRKNGYMANLPRVMEKVDRLRSLMWVDGAESQVPEETLNETVLDLINTAAFLAINISEGNRWGDR